MTHLRTFLPDLDHRCMTSLCTFPHLYQRCMTSLRTSPPELDQWCMTRTFPLDLCISLQYPVPALARDAHASVRGVGLGSNPLLSPLSPLSQRRLRYHLLDATEPEGRPAQVEVSVMAPIPVTTEDEVVDENIVDTGLLGPGHPPLPVVGF